MMKIKKHKKGFLQKSDKFIVVDGDEVLYISRNYNACERYIEKHKN
jgi:hypothetical protein